MYIAFFGVVIILTALVRLFEVYAFGYETSKSEKDVLKPEKESIFLSHKEFAFASEKDGDFLPSRVDFSRFQSNYLLVYLLAVAADWVQGPYVYALYTHYGYSKRDIGLLYIAGFASSAIFGTLVASVADKYGRRNNAVMYCIMYILSCLTKHSPNFYLLLVGRLFGGIATSILFSAFESWMVFEHTERLFPPKLLSSTFAKAQFGNGIVAITSGLVAGFFADRYGKVMPFDISITVLATLMVVIVKTWPENYGDESQSITGGFARAWTSLVSDERILLLGVTQACFESALYVFTFVWTPALQTPRAQVLEIPHGTIFATFMAATMMGSSIFACWSRYSRVEFIMRSMFAIGFVVFLVALVTESIMVTYLSFVVFEILCGIYFPAMATMRAPYIPEESRSALLTFFRVPLNIIVVVALYEDLEINTVFAMCALLMLCATVSQRRLMRLARYAPDSPDFDSVSKKNAGHEGEKGVP